MPVPMLTVNHLEKESLELSHIIYYRGMVEGTLTNRHHKTKNLRCLLTLE